jgi:hypothetical protein
MPGTASVYFCTLLLVTLVGAATSDISNTTSDEVTPYSSPLWSHPTLNASRSSTTSTITFISYVTVSVGNGTMVDTSSSNAVTEAGVAEAIATSYDDPW